MPVRNSDPSYRHVPGRTAIPELSASNVIAYLFGRTGKRQAYRAPAEPGRRIPLLSRGRSRVDQ